MTYNRECSGSNPTKDDEWKSCKGCLETDKYGLNAAKGVIESMQYGNWIKIYLIVFFNIKNTLCKNSRCRWKVYVKLAVLQAPCYNVKFTLEQFYEHVRAVWYTEKKTFFFLYILTKLRLMLEYFSIFA